MQVNLEPVDAASGGSLRRSLSMLAPFGLLGLFVTVALLGALPAQNFASPVATPGDDDNGGAVPAATSQVVEEAVPTSPAAGGADAVTALAELTPRYAFDLPVRAVDRVVSVRDAGLIGDGLMAVSGYLSPDPGAGSCGAPPLDLSDAFCVRTAVLIGTPAPIAQATADGELSVVRPTPWDAHLHAQILRGTPIPDVFDASLTGIARAIPPARVVVIGRFGDPRAEPCASPGVHCGMEFVIERLAWADGKWIDLTVVRHPDVPDGVVETHGIRAQAIAAREADRMESILSATVIPLGDLATLDSNAADLATASAGMLQMTVAQPVWYLRSVGRRWPGEERELTWAVIGHDSGLVLASGPRRPD